MPFVLREQFWAEKTLQAQKGGAFRLQLMPIFWWFNAVTMKKDSATEGRLWPTMFGLSRLSCTGLRLKAGGALS
ncbi:hypothetical protein ACI01nite_04570 [Acetobacter cibinongensis]|uniref:Uncharacterized protein n=1 Tax=Acetobacter cibinongensis TaxID=146475 RepID=A0A0D6N6Y0_9PROT|nr:hypothetical protein Abci_018_121 [Acetobacter cibinongensis]GBQ17203.1 hypothetical protein AA0482_1829 [Acetobacter cibinongensis NRIC 0482]GEL57855.1 hypothetical protein ACI01nite_04570 [Acetobacter cibinongensis]